MIKKVFHIGRRVITPSLIRYLAVGITAFLVEYISFVALIAVIHQSVLAANFISFGLGLMTSFLSNKFWTFGSNVYHHKTSQQLQMYIALALINLVATLIFVQLFTTVGVVAEISKLAAMILTSLWNYFLFKKIIFKHIK